MGEASSRLGFQVALVAYPLLVLALTGSAAKAGLAGFARTLPWLLLSLPAGALIDRLNRKQVMVFSDLGACIALLTIPVAVWMGRLSFAQVVVVAFVEGGCLVFFRIAETGALRSVVSAEQLPDAVAANDARAYAAQVAGTPLGGALFGLSRALPFLVDGLTYLVSLALVLATRKDFQEQRAPSVRRLRAEMAEGARWLWAQPFLRTALLLVGASNLVFAGLVLAAVVVAKEQGASPVLIGVMLASVGIGGILGALAAPWLRRRITPRAVVVGFNWIYVVVLVGLVEAPDALVIGALLSALSFFGPTWNAVVDGYRISIIPDALIGRAQSFDSLVAFGTASLGPLIAGVLLEVIGGDGTFLVLAAFMLVLAIVSSLTGALREMGRTDTIDLAQG
jgi:predicted MFS family arabinose efflux permease